MQIILKINQVDMFALFLLAILKMCLLVLLFFIFFSILDRTYDSIHIFDKAGPTSPNNVLITSFRSPSKSQLKILTSPHKTRESRSIDYISKMTHVWNLIVKSGDTLDKYSIE